MPGTTLKDGRYEIRETLGRSTTAVVYKCYDIAAGREVALKIVLEAVDKATVETFFRECNLLASLRHPNILEILDAGELVEGGATRPYFTMPVVAGAPLERLIQAAPAGLPVERAVDIVCQVARGLQAAHERGVFHRGLRPANIFVLDSGAVEISGFGVARLAAAGPGAVSPFYMAPEQLQMKPASALSDIFAAGVVAYESLTGQRPFEGAGEPEVAGATLRRTPPAVSERNPAANALIAQVVHKAMARQPWHRFASARDLGDALARAARNEPTAALDPVRIRPRIERAERALEQGDTAAADEIVGELEGEGWLDPAIPALRRKIELAPPRPPEAPVPRAPEMVVPPAPPPDNAALIAEVDRRIAAEPDLEKRIEMMRVAAERFPLEPHFQRALAQLRDERDRARAAAPPAQPDLDAMAREGQALCAAGRFEEGIEVLGRAYDRDPQNPRVRAALVEAALRQARVLLDTDPRRAGELAGAALSLDPANADARSLQALVEERRRDQFVEECVAQARKLHLTGDLAGAVARVEEGLRAHPAATQLAHYQEFLRKALQEPAPEVRAPAPPPPQPLATAVTAQPTDLFAAPAAPAATGAGPAPLVTNQVPAAPPRHAAPRRSPPWKLIGIGAGAAVLIIGVLAGVVSLSHRGPAPVAALVALDVRTQPPGAAVLVNQQPRGTSNCQLQLAPGSYEVQAVLAGYRPGLATLTLRAGIPGVVDLTLEPLGAALRVFTDLDPARLTIDGQKPVEFQGGQFVLDLLPEGPHKLQIAGAHGEATVPVEVGRAGPPQVTGAVAAREIAAVVVSNLGGQVRIYASLSGAKAMVDGKPAGEIGPSGLELTNLPSGGHELAIGEGRDHRKLSFETGMSPSLTAFLNSDRNAGTLVVIAGEDGAAVWIDGKPQRRTTKGGQLRIPNLAVKRYAVRVAKQGFQEAAGQQVEIRKGEDSRLVFQLKPVPTVAAVLIEGAVPGAQVLVDGNAAGTIGPDGSFSLPNLAPGEHSVELRKEQYRPRVIQRSFPAGQSVRLGAADVALEAIPKPPEPKPAPKPAPVAKPVPVVAKIGMEGWANPAGWQANGVWQMQRGGEFVLFRPTPAGGAFVFTVTLQRGKRLRWVARYAGEKNYVLFEMDDKNFYRKVVTNGKTSELLKQPHGLGKQKNLTCALDIQVAPHRLLQRIGSGDKWTVLDDWTDPGGNFTQGPFGFLIHGKDEIGITNFSFTPAQ